MDKKELKFYEAPACEVVELKLQGPLLDASQIEGVSDPNDITGGNNDEEF